MEALRKLKSLFKKQEPAYMNGAGFLSATEMDVLFGGKPEEIKSEESYWWFDENQLTDSSISENKI